MFVVFILGVNAPEVLNALTDMRCLKLESCPSKILRIVITGMVDLFILNDLLLCVQSIYFE